MKWRPQIICGGAVLLLICGCGQDQGEESSAYDGLPYASAVSSFEEGSGAGHGAENLPEVVLGPPAGAAHQNAATGRDEVLSLGIDGEIVLAFEPMRIVDGPGADFVVFENPFWVRDDPTEVWAELGEVSVSEDGEEWQTFECDPQEAEPGRWPGCAGWTPTRPYEPEELLPLDPQEAGGDAFDLAEVGLEQARFVRIRDIEGAGDADFDNLGFDLDAVGVVNFR